MELLENIQLKNLLKNSLKKSSSYSKYRADVGQLVINRSTSGSDKTEDLIEYTLLNDRRMKRWDKSIKVTDLMKERVANFKGDVTWLVITESWCGDAAHVIPAINKIAELSDHITLKLIYRDQNEDLMNHFLTNGSKSIPKLIMIDNPSGHVLGTFGPRPSGATQLVMDHKKKHGSLTPDFKEELQHWYNSDKGQNTIENLLTLLKV